MAMPSSFPGRSARRCSPGASAAHAASQSIRCLRIGVRIAASSRWRIPRDAWPIRSIRIWNFDCSGRTWCSRRGIGNDGRCGEHRNRLEQARHVHEGAALAKAGLWIGCRSRAGFAGHGVHDDRSDRRSRMIPPVRPRLRLEKARGPAESAPGGGPPLIPARRLASASFDRLARIAIQAREVAASTFGRGPNGKRRGFNPHRAA